MKTITNSQLEDFRRAAKRLKKDLGITHSEALEKLSKEAGFQDYHHLQQSVSDPRPHQGLVSNMDDKYRLVPVKPGKFWFTLDVKDAERYDHKTFPKRWGIKKDQAKWNAITADLEAAHPDIPLDDCHPSFYFYSWQRVFCVTLPHAKTLLDIVSYVREIFFWPPIYVFQDDTAYDFYDDKQGKDYASWLKDYGLEEEEEIDLEFIATSKDGRPVSFQG